MIFTKVHTNLQTPNFKYYTSVNAQAITLQSIINIIQGKIPSSSQEICISKKLELHQFF